MSRILPVQWNIGLQKHLNRKIIRNISMYDLTDKGKILITGGSGVLGSYIAEHLRKEFDIVVADLEKPQIENVKFSKLDCLKPFSIADDFEIIIHLARVRGWDSILYKTSSRKYSR